MKNGPFLLIKVFMEIKDKVIVITGAARGLGKNFALDLANRGAKLALADINQELLEEVRKTCEQAGTEARACLLYTSPSPRDRQKSRMPSSA